MTTCIIQDGSPADRAKYAEKMCEGRRHFPGHIYRDSNPDVDECTLKSLEANRGCVVIFYEFDYHTATTKDIKFASYVAVHGRHFDIMVLVLVNSLYSDVPPQIRENADEIITLK